MKKNLIVKQKNHNQRLDVFLAEAIEITRSQAQKLLDKKVVLLNDALPKKDGERVKEGDSIVVQNKTSPRALSSAEAREIDVATSPSQRGGQGGVSLAPTIIAETTDYIVLNKPSGLLVHPTQAREKNSLVAWLKKKYPQIKTVGDDPAVRPGIVHRLDKEASGLMVVAKTQKMFDHLKEQFKNRTVEKEYLALVHGKVAKDWDEITFAIARGENADRMAARPLPKAKYVSTLAKQPVILSGTKDLSDDNVDSSRHPDSVGAQNDSGEKSARTEFFVEKRFVNFGLLRVIIHTGRMHQIRVHMLAYNHPLVGDPLYTQKKQKRVWDNKLGRLFLHSTKLGFTDLNGEKKIFESPLPEELKKFLTTLA